MVGRPSANVELTHNPDIKGSIEGKAFHPRQQIVTTDHWLLMTDG